MTPKPVDPYRSFLGRAAPVLALLHSTCDEHGVTLEHVFRTAKQKNVIEARAAIFVTLHALHWTHGEIARLFLRPQTTVRHTIQRHHQRQGRRVWSKSSCAKSSSNPPTPTLTNAS